MTDDQRVPQSPPLQPTDKAPTSQASTQHESEQPRKETACVGGSGDTGAELEIWVGRTHWKHYAGRLVVWITCNVLFAAAVAWIAARFDQLTSTIAFWLIACVLLASGVLVIGRVVLIILSHRYRVTSQRLFIERGILSQTVDQTELIRVDDVRLYKSILDRMFGLGSVAVVSTDATDKEILLEGVPEPDKVAESIRSNMRTLRQRSLFVENL